VLHSPNTSSSEIDVSQQPPGIYLLRVLVEGGVAGTEKVVISH
jgi:hypothetical protein